MIDLTKWTLSDEFQWGYVWIDEDTGERLEYHLADTMFVLNDYHIINSTHVNFYKYYPLVTKVSQHD